jgi:hypothetical protein
MGHRRTRRTRKTRRIKNRRQKGGDILPSFNENKNEENKDSGIFGKVSEWLENPNWFPESSIPSTSSQNAGRRRRRRKHRRTYKK